MKQLIRVQQPSDYGESMTQPAFRTQRMLSIQQKTQITSFLVGSILGGIAVVIFFVVLLFVLGNLAN